MLFSFARAYFMVDMKFPAPTGRRSLMPQNPAAEFGQRAGFAKQAKPCSTATACTTTQRHSTDRFRIAPGIRAW